MSTETAIVLEELHLGSDPPNPPTLKETGSNRELHATASVAHQLQQWNNLRINIFRTFAAFWGFIVMGTHGAAVGLEEYYKLSYTVVAMVFLCPIAGYVVTTLTNFWFHSKFGQRGISILCPACHIIAYTVAALHPPFPVLVVAYALGGFGSGLFDAAWNAWIGGSLANTNEILGLLHGFWGLGATLGPLVATSLITKVGVPWYYFYYVVIGVSVIELVASSLAFWQATAAKYREEHSRPNTSQRSVLKEALTGRSAARVTWLAALFLSGYVGIEVALGGWITTFMLRVRHGQPFASGMAATGFWLGITVGRVVLGFVTPRIGEKFAIMIYLPVCMGLELLFWLVPQFYVSTVSVGLLGFFLGPFFPAAILVTTRLLPSHLHVTAIGFAAALGGCGAAVFPFAVAAIAQARGVQVLQPIILAMLVVLFLIWVALLEIEKRSD